MKAFLDRGELRLSSFAQFSRHRDEARGDTDEGSAWVTSEGGGQSFGAWVRTGQNAYVLCGSLTKARDVRDAFPGADGCLEIFDVPQFGLAVSRQLSGFVGGLSGHCIYAGRTLLRHVLEDPFPIEPGGADIPIDRLFQATAHAAQHEHLLLKDRRFAWQTEYRLLWDMDHPVDEPLVVKCPEAAKFCRLVDPAEIA